MLDKFCDSQSERKVSFYAWILIQICVSYSAAQLWESHVKFCENNTTYTVVATFLFSHLLLQENEKQREREREGGREGERERERE